MTAIWASVIPSSRSPPTSIGLGHRAAAPVEVSGRILDQDAASRDIGVPSECAVRLRAIHEE